MKRKFEVIGKIEQTHVQPQKKRKILYEQYHNISEIELRENQCCDCTLRTTLDNDVIPRKKVISTSFNEYNCCLDFQYVFYDHDVVLDDHYLAFQIIKEYLFEDGSDEVESFNYFFCKVTVNGEIKDECETPSGVFDYLMITVNLKNKKEFLLPLSPKKVDENEKYLQNRITRLEQLLKMKKKKKK